MGYILIFDGCPLLWSSILQTEIVLSMMEADNIALCQSMHDPLLTCELSYELLQCLGYSLNKVLTHSTVFEGNKGAITLAANNAPWMSPHSKHIKYHFFREQVAKGIGQIRHIQMENQNVDISTKGLTVHSEIPKSQEISGR